MSEPISIPPKAAEKLSALPKICRDIFSALLSHPDGLDIVQIRQIVAPAGVQQHLDRRLRQLDPIFRIERRRDGPRFIYKLVGARADGEWDFETIPKDLAARIYYAAHGKCQMCGKTIAEDGIRLHLDHKIPRSWGGPTIAENLWAICSQCNEGKKNYFSTFDEHAMTEILADESPHARLLKTLRLSFQNWIRCDLLEFVANFNDYQTEWRKRTRELRFLGYDVESRIVREPNRAVSEYRLTNWFEPPKELGRAIREVEKERKKRKKGQNPKDFHE